MEPIADIEGVISFATRPWPTLDKFERRRENFEDYKRSQRRVLKTVRDYIDAVEWSELRGTRKALRTNSRGLLPNLARAIIAEALRQPLCERKPYKEIAEIFTRTTGCVVTERTIQDIRRKRDQISRQCVFHLSTTDVEFARRYGTNPIAVDQLRASIVPGSIAESQFAEIWERRLPAPALLIGEPESRTDGRPSSGATGDFRRQDAPDLRSLYQERLKLLVRNVDEAEARARSYDFTVFAYRNHCGCDLEAAKQAVLSAINQRGSTQV
jgi:hypothetical protein